tara:strand:+ start:13905 stop:15665 length:1761 start_codon:yes stop_codon:yes gene_type:complete
MVFGYTDGLWALLILVPFIILYLIRPKMVKMKIPSLMFLMHDESSKQKLSFLRKFLRDPLFLIQFFLILALAFAVAEPFIILPKQETATNTVLIVDGSASMQTTFNGKSRFDDAIERALDDREGRVSVVLAGQVPELHLDSGGSTRAGQILRGLDARDTATNIAGAMFLAKDLLTNKKGQVIVYSDFLSTNTEDNILVAKRALNAEGVIVRLENVGGEVENIGIIDLDVSKTGVLATVKNYAPEAREVQMQLIKEDKAVEAKTLKLGPRSVEKIGFPTLPGVSIVKVNAIDNFELDNLAYVSSPLGDKIKVLMITNNENNFIKKAMEAASIFEIEVREPPIVKAFDLDHDVIVLADIEKTIVPSDVIDIKRYMQKGALVIVAGDESVPKLGIQDLLPITVKGTGESTGVNVKIINVFTKDKDFGTSKKHIIAEPRENAIVYAVGDDDSPMLAELKVKKGTLLWYGIFDRESEFKATEDYPIFWFTLMTTLLQTEDIREYNFKLEEQPGQYEQGVHEVKDKVIALNLLHELESDVGRTSSVIQEDTSAFQNKSFKGFAKQDFSVPLLIIGLLLVLFEIFYLKWRGDF